ncbi:MAG: hypothetical protein RIR53_1056 [Bacteroidota bacterium]
MTVDLFADQLRHAMTEPAHVANHVSFTTILTRLLSRNEIMTTSRVGLSFILWCMPLLISIATLSIGLSAQPPWKLLTSYPRDCGQMGAATSPDGRRAVTIGWWGSMYFSSDSGKTWSLRMTGIFENIESVAYYSDSGIAVVAQNGSVLLSTDEFRTWRRLRVDAADELTRVRRVKHNTLLCLSRSGVVYRSQDGGQNWSAVYRGTAPLRDVAIAPDGRALAVGEGGIVIMSRDAGLSWFQTAGRAPDTVRLLRAAFVRDSTWMIAGDTSYLARTTNEGATWNTREPIPSKAGRMFTVRAMAFNDSGDGLILHNNMYIPDGFLSITRDGGDTWDRARASTILSNDAMVLTDISFFPGSVTGIMSGVLQERVSWIRLWDEGVWIDRFNKESRYSDDRNNDKEPLFYLRSNNGSYLLGRDHQKVQMVTEYSPVDDRVIRQWKQNDSSSRVVFDSTGFPICSMSWRYYGADKLNDRQMVIYADSVVDSANGTEHYGRLLRTDDGGATWQTHHVEMLHSAAEPNRTFWKSASEGLIQSRGHQWFSFTTDGGASWKTKAQSKDYDSLLVELVTADSTAFIGIGRRSADGRNELLRSADGLEWELLLSDVPDGRRVIKNGTFMLILARDAIYSLDIAADGSWAKLTRRCDSDGKDSGPDGLSCFAQDVLVTMRAGGSMMISKDSGCTMVGPLQDPLLDYLRSNRMSILNSLFAINDVVYLAFGKGHIAKGVINMATVGVEDYGDITTNPPYPNPVATTTSIRVGWYVTVPPSTLTLKVYNQLGQEVRDLTRELRMRAEGLASVVTFDTSELPPGVYYAVTRAGNTVSTQQIMVQR